jgi:hypothetical protein
MDKRINKKTEVYISEFKNKICQIIKENEDTNKIIEFIYEYPRLTFNNDDFIKRKRLKNKIPDVNRCSAKRANGEQCTRRKKDNCDFCGTHFKNAPHGLITSENSKNKTIEIYTQDIKGIIYYIDNFNNVYAMNDVLQNKKEPRKIATYEKKNNNYSISFY